MNFEDRIKIPKPIKDAKRGLVTVAQAKASLERALKGVSQTYGFQLEANDPRFSIVSTGRSGDFALIVYGARGRKLDASQLAYELNN